MMTLRFMILIMIMMAMAMVMMNVLSTTMMMIMAMSLIMIASKVSTIRGAFRSRFQNRKLPSHLVSFVNVIPSRQVGEEGA